MLIIPGALNKAISIFIRFLPVPFAGYIINLLPAESSGAVRPLTLILFNYALKNKILQTKPSRPGKGHDTVALTPSISFTVRIPVDPDSSNLK